MFFFNLFFKKKNKIKVFFFFKKKNFINHRMYEGLQIESNLKVHEGKLRFFKFNGVFQKGWKFRGVL
jgi:hypothetical protein